VPFEPGDPATREPDHPQAFAVAFAQRLDAVLSDLASAEAMGKAGRARVVERFAWPAIAEETAALYRRLAETGPGVPPPPPRGGSGTP